MNANSRTDFFDKDELLVLNYEDRMAARAMLNFDAQYLEEKLEVAKTQLEVARCESGEYSKPHRHAVADLDYHWINYAINQIALQAIDQMHHEQQNTEAA